MTRRLFKRYEVWCDGAGCPMWAPEDEAKQLGWTKIKRRHYCPACSQELARARGVPVREVASEKEKHVR